MYWRRGVRGVCLLALVIARVRGSGGVMVFVMVVLVVLVEIMLR